MPEHSTTTLAGAILDLLWRAGVKECFGIPGVHNLAFWNALDTNRPKIIGVRHEQTCVYAADGLARSTGKLAVAITTTGPGAANTLGAFGEAAISGSPVLVISSEAPIAKRHKGGSRGLLHEMNDQSALFKPLAKIKDGVAMAISVTDANSAIAAVVEFISGLTDAPSGAGYIGIPADLLAAEFVGDVPTASKNELAVPDLAPAIKELSGKSKIGIWVGGGGIAAEREIGNLATHLSAPIFTSFAARGVCANNPLTLQAPIHEPEVANLMAECDALIVIGSQLDGMNTKNWNIPFPKSIVVIDADPTVLLRNISPKIIVETANLTAALTTLGQLPSQNKWADLTALNAKVRSRLLIEEKSVKGITLVAAIEDNWPADGAIVCDMAVAGYWTGVYAKQPRPRRLSYPVGWGTLGFGLPAAIGPAASGIKTLAVCGDGGVAFALGELATIVQEKLPYTLLIVDDGGYGMLRYDQQVAAHPERGVDLFSPDWELLAKSFGLAFIETGLAGLGRALTQIQPGIILIKEKLYPPKSTSPRWHE